MQKEVFVDDLGIDFNSDDEREARTAMVEFIARMTKRWSNLRTKNWPRPWRATYFRHPQFGA